MLEGKGTTAKLWVVYFRMITIVKHTIQAERMGDCKLHLTCAVRMILFFMQVVIFNTPNQPTIYDKITICDGKGRI